MPFELLQITIVLGIHLAVQNIDPLNPESCRFIDHCLDGNLRVTKMPVRIRRDAQLDALGRRNSRFGQTRKASE